jgi:tetratricopeptide (TPR) repeat protein
MMREQIVRLLGPPVRAMRAGRFPLSPVVARLSPRHGTMMSSYRLEEEGKFDQALDAWSMLNGSSQSRVAAFRFKLRSARLALKAGQFALAVKELSVLHALNPGDTRVAKDLENAALRAARKAQSEARWLEACRMWSAHAHVTARTDKSVRNLGLCARYVAQSADSVEKMTESLEAWGLLKALEPDSRQAKQGLEWCRLSLARAAERAGDVETARKHWNALLELSPGDQRALDGLKRLSAAGA